MRKGHKRLNELKDTLTGETFYRVRLGGAAYRDENEDGSLYVPAPENEEGLAQEEEEEMEEMEAEVEHGEVEAMQEEQAQKEEEEEEVDEIASWLANIPAEEMAKLAALLASIFAAVEEEQA